MCRETMRQCTTQIKAYQIAMRAEWKAKARVRIVCLYARCDMIWTYQLKAIMAQELYTRTLSMTTEASLHSLMTIAVE